MLDCLIVHAPKFQNRYAPLGNYTSTQWMALGIFALADFLRRGGLSARILHLGLEKNLSPRFTLSRYLSRTSCRVVAFSLHFHQQLYDTLRAVEAVKKHDPSLCVVLGGMTASFFAEEILARCPKVDAVIRGEGEVPLRQLVAAVKAGKRDFPHVPNLLWRRDGSVVHNEGVYVASQKELDALEFCDFSLMEHYEQFVGMPKIFTRLALPAKLRWKVSQVLSQKWKQRIYFALPVGRGCATSCFYCGGGANAQKLINARRGVIFRSHEKVIESIRRLIGYGFQGAYVSFDPRPEGDAYYRKLFAKMRAEGIRFEFFFPCWGLPSREFIDEFGKTCGGISYIAISPETGSERLRKRSRGYSFSNAELMDTLRHAEERHVRTLIFLSLGIPGETREDFEETLRLKAEIERDFRYSQVDAFSIEIEPAAPWHLNPEQYGIVLTRKGLDDFLRDQGSPSYSSMSSLGYYRDEYLGEPVSGSKDYAAKVLAAKCRHFCSQRKSCAIAAAVWGATRLLGLNPSGDVEI
jgi:radical SAM superfamily enzyme YgiQ (UPF0313 family)